MVSELIFAVFVLTLAVRLVIVLACALSAAARVLASVAIWASAELAFASARWAATSEADAGRTSALNQSIVLAVTGRIVVKPVIK